MKKTIFLKVWIVLIVLTIISAIISNSNLVHKGAIILVLSVFKFIGITFYFMELKKAHLFWKISVFAFLSVFLMLSLTFL
ncbi:cytochrome C oxidase subunit IV family protein [Lutibacter oricola]|uniref:cytochrome C oxidase subunit IV family protein n=1 Tax=Lutibacter oricola TaxID=762486 RepID=UPI000B7E82A7|nr:cytochrome C oxidase subunit IV family protein [Lutibacter oricola]